MDLTDIISALSGLTGGAAALVVIAIVLWRDSSTNRRLADYTEAMKTEVIALRRRVLVLENALRHAGLPIPLPEPDHDLEGVTP